MKDTVYIQPTSFKERIHVLDFLRGFSLFGVLLVNMTLFKTTLFDFPRVMMDYSDATDQWIALIIQIFISGKFISILSFLFGLGFYLFMERTEEKGLSHVPLYRRRLLSLLVFGIIHLVFIWNGDILHVYALAGLLLLLLRNKSLKGLLRWMTFSFLLSTVMIALAAWIEWWAEKMLGDEQNVMGKMAYETYTQGSFLEIVSFRAFFELPGVIIGLLYTIPFVLVMFLAGFYAGRRNVFRDLKGNLPLIRKVWHVSGFSGILLTLFYVCIELELLMPGQVSGIILLEVSRHISAILLGLFYITSLLLLLTSKKLSFKVLAPFTYIGRMTLSNYLLQSFIGVFIFYGFGLGYMGQINLVHVLLLTLGFFSLQVVLSYFWLKCFQFGPVEWIWREITYKKIGAG